MQQKLRNAHDMLSQQPDLRAASALQLFFFFFPLVSSLGDFHFGLAMVIGV
jgi:hypothetical protein